MVLRALLLLLALGCGGLLRAQLGDMLFRMLHGDTTGTPDFDTAWVKSYRDDLVVSPVIASQNQSITLARKDERLLRFSTNTPVQYGLALDYKWLGLEYTTTVPGLGQVDEDRGETETRGLGIGYTGRSWWFRSTLRTSRGFHAEEPRLVQPDWTQGQPYPYRPDLRTVNWYANLSHGFNTRRYSHTAALWQMERQKRSAGSWIAGTTIWFTRTEAGESLVPAFQTDAYTVPRALAAVQRWMVGLTGGCTGTLSLWGRGFINAMLLPGVGAQRQVLEATDGSRTDAGWDLALTAELRVGAGYVGDRWYASIVLQSFQNDGVVEPDVQLGNGLATGRMAFGWRFHRPGPFIPRLGL